MGVGTREESRVAVKWEVRTGGSLKGEGAFILAAYGDNGAEITLIKHPARRVFFPVQL